MDQLQDVFGELNSTFGELLANPYISATVTIFVILYAGLAAPELPGPIAKLFDHTVVKILVLAAILFVNNYNPTVALVVAVAFFLTLQTLSRHKMFGLAAHVSKLKGSLGLANGAAGAAEEEEEEGGAEYTPGEYDLTMAEGASDETQVSGLAQRTDVYQGPQGMQHPVGYAGEVEGSDVMY